MFAVYLILFWSICASCDIIPKQQRFYDIDKSGLRQYWELISWQGLIKAKVKTILPELRHVERVLYALCAHESDNLVKLAKCAVIVFEKRDKLRVERSNLFFIKRRRMKKRRKKRPPPIRLDGRRILHYKTGKEFIVDRKRRKRLKKLLWEITQTSAPRIKVRRVKRSHAPYIEALDQMKEHYRKLNIVNSYYELIDSENKKLYKRLQLPIFSKKEKSTDGFEESMKEILRVLNSYTNTNDTVLSMLSPRLFSVLPDVSRRPLLSPNILSFQGDGLFSMPKLTQIITGSNANQKDLLEWILMASGAGEQIMKMLHSREKEIYEIATVHFPLVQKMSRNDYNWLMAGKSFTSEQNEEIVRNGFTYLTPKQQQLIYQDTGHSFNSSYLTRRDKERWLEDKIRDLSGLQTTDSLHHRRVKRQEGAAEEGETTLVPVAFTNMVNEGVALELVTLSPQAFVSSTLGPEAFSVYTISPDAFLAAILSPVALVARILSPAAFIAEILSARAFTPYILTPRVFLVEILTPRAFEPHIASPDVMVIDILSPAGLSPQVLSPEMGAVIILSPKFLSPRTASAEKFLIEILSPHILGGPHTSHDETVISIGGGEHSHDHRPGDEGTAAHQEDIHVHEGQLEGDHAHQEEMGYNPFGFTLIPTIPPKDDYFQLNDLINPTIPPDGDILGFKYLTPAPNGDILGLHSATLLPILQGK